MTATRSQASATIPRLWVISSSAVSKFSRRSARMREDLRLDEHVERRRRLVGDHEGSGRSTSASAIMIRWRMPPENSCGYCL